MTDTILENKIKKLEKDITSWAKKYYLWTDCTFKTYIDHFEDEPDEATAWVSVLCLGGEMYDVINENDPALADEFHALLETTDFTYEMYDSSHILFYAKDDTLNEQYLDYLEWQWISKLIKPNYTDLYHEIFDYFNINPKKLYSLTPRQLEILTSEIFRNQGYLTELGSGWNDGGVDLRIYQKDDIDQIVTLVQVKKYKDSIPIGLESVAYLNAIVDEEKANRGLFITTSRYLPQAKKFALRQNKRLKLADSSDLSNWCEQVKTRIIRDKSQSLTDDYILNLLKVKDETSLIGKIVRASTGYNMITNDFCIVLKDSPYATLLMRMPSEAVNYIEPPFRGYEVPVLNESILKNKNKDDIFRARKSFDEMGRVHFWGQRRLYYIWEGKPEYFDMLD